MFISKSYDQLQLELWKKMAYPWLGAQHIFNGSAMSSGPIYSKPFLFASSMSITSQNPSKRKAEGLTK